MEDVRPALEVETAPEVKTAMQSAAETYSRLAHDAGNLSFQLKEMGANLEDIYVKMRNARVDYLKAKKVETSAHQEAATNVEGVTQ